MSDSGKEVLVLLLIKVLITELTASKILIVPSNTGSWTLTEVSFPISGSSSSLLIAALMSLGRMRDKALRRFCLKRNYDQNLLM